MEWDLKQESDDLANTTWTSRTARTIKDIVNSSNKMLRCTVETCEDFSDGRLPTLDTNIWMEGRRVLEAGIRMHMSASAGAEGRNIRKLLAKTSWYNE